MKPGPGGDLPHSAASSHAIIPELHNVTKPVWIDIRFGELIYHKYNYVLLGKVFVIIEGL